MIHAEEMKFTIGLGHSKLHISINNNITIINGVETSDCAIQ
jgi:hypothetical protein